MLNHAMDENKLGEKETTCKQVSLLSFLCASILLRAPTTWVWASLNISDCWQLHFSIQVRFNLSLMLVDLFEVPRMHHSGRSLQRLQTCGHWVPIITSRDQDVHCVLVWCGKCLTVSIVHTVFNACLTLFILLIRLWSGTVAPSSPQCRAFENGPVSYKQSAARFLQQDASI